MNIVVLLKYWCTLFPDSPFKIPNEFSEAIDKLISIFMWNMNIENIENNQNNFEKFKVGIFLLFNLRTCYQAKLLHTSRI